MLHDGGRRGVFSARGVPLAALSAASLLLASLASLATPDTEPEPARWHLAGGMGTGYVAQVECGGCPRFRGGGVAFTFEAGARLRSDLAFVGRLSMTTVPFADNTDGFLLDLSPAVLWSVSDRLWVSAAVGWGRLSLDENRPDDSIATLWSANGLATSAAIAGDLVRLGNTMAIYAELRVLALITGRFSSANGALVFGFRWR